MPKPKLLLTHTDSDREALYPPETLAALRELVDLKLNNSPMPLAGDALLQAAASAQIIVCDPRTSGAGLFAVIPALVAYICDTADIHKTDVAAASTLGILVVTARSEDTIDRLKDILRGVAPGGSVNADAAHRLRRFAPPLAPEIGGTEGPEPTRYGDWQHKGRVSDF